MKRIILAALLVAIFAFKSFSQTTLTVDANSILNYPKIIAYTGSGQSFFTGHQAGSGYSYPNGIFRAITDNPNGSSNYYYDGLTNGTINFSVRADGQGYFAGNIGIGTTTPNAKLQVSGTFIAGGNKGNLDPAGSSLPNSLANTGQMLIGWNRTAGQGETDFISNQGTGSTGGFMFYNHDNNNNETQLMQLLGNGQLLIGNTQGKQGSYLLAVAGSEVATSITVKTVSNWPDYIFHPNYTLLPLNDLKTYIDQNHHLPGIPTESEIHKSGLNLGEIDQALVKKVEELTLYLISKDNQLKEEETRNNEQEKQLKALQSEVSSLKAQIEMVTTQLKH